MTTHTIDCEPSWSNLMPLFIDMAQNGKRDYVLSELKKVAKVADIVRQAQKKGKCLLFTPDGEFYIGLNVTMDGQEYDWTGKVK